jgi:hypothetical protein
MGNVGRFDDNDEFKNAFKAAAEQVRDEHIKRDEEEGEVSRLKEELELERQKSEKAIALGEALAARAYAERRLNGHPQAPAIRKQIDESAPVTTQQVDSLIESFETEHPTSTEFEDIFGSVGGKRREELAGGLSHLQEGLEDLRDIDQPGGNGISSDGIWGRELIEQVRQAAGISGKKDDENLPY